MYIKICCKDLGSTCFAEQFKRCFKYFCTNVSAYHFRISKPTVVTIMISEQQLKLFLKTFLYFFVQLWFFRRCILYILQLVATVWLRFSSFLFCFGLLVVGEYSRTPYFFIFSNFCILILFQQI